MSEKPRTSWAAEDVVMAWLVALLPPPKGKRVATSTWTVDATR